MTTERETPTTDAVLANLLQQLAALGDVRDVVQTERELEAFYGKRAALDARIFTLRNAPNDIEKLDPQIAAIKKWCDHLTAWRTEFTKRIAALPASADSRTRAQEQEVAGLTAAIKNIDFGCRYSNEWAVIAGPLRERIMAAYTPTWDMPTLDPWAVGYGPLPTAQQRLAELTKRRDEAQARLDAALCEPEAAMVTS
jgi:hypothetical protein